MSRDAALDRLIGQVLGARYRIGERVGAGAMGTVFRAEHVKLGRKLAVKVLHPQMVRNDKYRRRFDREAELAGRLRHPNVVGVLDVGITPEGLRYLVMEYAEGPTLGELIRKGAMDGPRVAALAKQLCDGLHHAHEHGLVHRDFKPDNVIVERDQYGAELPRIVDFGIAIAIDDFGADERERLTTEGLVLGTPHYMAPEHASGQPIDHRADLFALGVICYEMLTGRLPFDGSGVEIARAYLSRQIPAMNARAPAVEVDPLLEAFARALLVRSRDERLPSAKAARDLVELIERDRHVAARLLGVAHEGRRTLPVSGAPPPGLQGPAPPRKGSGTQPPRVEWTELPTEQMVPAERAEQQPPPQPEVPSSERVTRIAGPMTAREPVRAELADSTTTPARAIVEPEASVSVYVSPMAAATSMAAAPAEPAPPPAPPMAVPPAPPMTAVPPAPPMTAAPLMTPLAVEIVPGAATPRRRAAWTEDDREPAPPRRRAAWIAGVLIALGVCAVAVIALRRAPAGEPTAAAPAPPTARPPTAPPAAPPAQPPAPAAPPPPTAIAQPPALPPAPAPAPVPSAPPPASPRPPAVPPSPPPTVVLRPPEVPSIAPPPAPPPTETPAEDPTTQVLAALYAAVGRSLKQLDDTIGKASTSDLWPRYLRIHINEALGSRDKRIEAHQTLRYLEREIVRLAK